MPRASRENPVVREFILRNVEKNQGSIAALAAKELGLSRNAISGYMRRLVAEGLLSAEGKTRGRRYALRDLHETYHEIEVSPGLAEDQIWRARIVPQVEGIKQNIIDLCAYGFTEMLNNVVDHSGSKTALISYTQNYTTIDMWVVDSGIGVFEKIQRDFQLSDPRHALLELSKGRLTSNERQHTGEGIFFTSRMFSRFAIRSGNLFYTRIRRDADDWLIETDDIDEYTQGTAIRMIISTDADWTTREVFDRYQTPELLFRKTHVPIKLARYASEQLVSRSQAKRILTRFDQFSEVLLDFQGVPQIGQAFADEIFRVFRTAHPETNVLAMNTSPEVKEAIEAASGQQVIG